MAYKWSEMKKREREAMVAENVMGWNLRSENLGYPPGNDNLIKFPHYINDISAAWDVVERLKQNGWNPRIEWNSTHQQWDVRFLDRTNYPRGMAMHELECHAICIAALRAVGVEVET